MYTKKSIISSTRKHMTDCVVTIEGEQVEQMKKFVYDFWFKVFERR